MFAIRRLEKLATEKEETKAIVSSRPKLAFETFTGDVSQYHTFLANQEELYKMFYDPNAPDKGVSQQLFQLKKKFGPGPRQNHAQLQRRREFGSEAADWLSLIFDSPKLMIPVIYQELKDISTARNKTKVPRVAERVLRKI